MKITILFFGISSDLVGLNHLEIELEKAISVAEFKSTLKKKYPNLERINSYSIAVNEEYAKDDFVINSNDVVAIIPPVSGG